MAKEYSRQSPLLAVVLNTLARDFVGDGKGINTYFVSDQGDVVTVTTDRQTATDHFDRLAARRPLQECTLEDRYTGVLASVEPETDEVGARLILVR